MDESVPRWAAVIVNYKSGAWLGPCIRSVLADDGDGAGEPEVVVVDNGSHDDSVAAIARDFPTVRVVTLATNLGYAGGVNRGVAATRAPVVAVMNADVTVVPGTAAAMLARIAAEPDLAAVGPVIMNPDGSQYPSARSVPSQGDAVGHVLLGMVLPSNRFTRRYRQLDVDPTRPRDVEWISGAALWLRRSALESVGGWDERYFMYVEDLDLCWRLRRLGWRVTYEPAGTVVHVQAVSTDQHPYRMIVRHHQSTFRFATKTWRGARRLLLLPTAVLLAVRAGIAVAARALGARPGRPRVTG
jgi:N-acetylglucosaminyl-diphospho-decaprenol L-rhamnosyltransferase